MQMDGVVAVDVNPKTSVMTLTYDQNLIQFEEVEKRAKGIGIELQKQYLHKTLKLSGLDCPDCALVLEKGVGKLNGVLLVSANFASSRLFVEYEPDRTDIDTVIQRIKDLGYGVVDADQRRGPSGEMKSAKRGPMKISKQAALTTIAGVSILSALILSHFGADVPAKVFYGIASLAGGFYAARGAVFSLRSFMLDMNFLMTVAAIGAVFIGEWFDAAMVMFLFSLGNALEARTMERTRESVRSLLDNFPAQARVRRDGVEALIPIENLSVGDTFIVVPGERIPTDGLIITGSTAVNQASVTGESMPVEKNTGDTVFAGTLNQQGAFEASATSTAEDNTLSKIIHMVEEAQAEKAPSQRFTESFGRYYTPVVIALAILTASVPALFFHADFIPWLHKALTLLVVSCPCALVISTPVSIVSAIGNAAHNGILIKGGTHLENAARIDVVVFDKTGTITSGEPSVVDIIPANGFSEAQLLSIAAGIESRSEHPLGRAIVRKARELGIAYDAASDCQSLTGMGASATLGGRRCIVGNPRLMEQSGVDIHPHEETITLLQEAGKTVVMVAVDAQTAGTITITDTMRPFAKEAFQELRRIGVKHIVMLTGDNRKAARAAADELGIDEYHAELLPQDKVDAVRKLTDLYGHHVAFVGDGVNDAPALASATVGIAMGVAGSDTALETADIALMSADLRRIPYAIRLGRSSLRTVRQNTVFALAVILVLISTALLGWINLSLGVFGHEGSALLVIANGMRLLKFR